MGGVKFFFEDGVEGGLTDKAVFCNLFRIGVRVFGDIFFRRLDYLLLCVRVLILHLRKKFDEDGIKRDEGVSGTCVG